MTAPSTEHREAPGRQTTWHQPTGCSRQGNTAQPGIYLRSVGDSITSGQLKMNTSSTRAISWLRSHWETEAQPGASRLIDGPSAFVQGPSGLPLHRLWGGEAEVSLCCQVFQGLHPRKRAGPIGPGGTKPTTAIGQLHPRLLECVTQKGPRQQCVWFPRSAEFLVKSAHTQMGWNRWYSHFPNNRQPLDRHRALHSPFRVIVRVVPLRQSCIPVLQVEKGLGDCHVDR